MPPDPRHSSTSLPPASPYATATLYTDPSLDTPDAAAGEPSTSTSASTPGAASSTSSSKKRKKLPSCDSCKLRRVLCNPQPAPGSCPRCKEKNIVCTTTPVVRRKPTGRSGKRIEEARAMFGTADPNSPNFAGPSNTPWIPSNSLSMPRIESQMPPGISSEDIDHQLGLQVLGGELTAHLLDLYQKIPQSWLPLFPRGRLSLMFEAVGRRLELLPPQAEVLAHTIIALTSRLSSHPLLLGTSGPPAPPFENLTPTFLATHADLREYGQRREAICDKLRRKAVRMSWERGTLVQSCEESMACCHLLEVLEGRGNPKAGKPYGSAFVSHLRTLLDEGDAAGAPKVINMSLGWSALIMREALYASNNGRTSHFSAADDILLCGAVPESIEEALLETVDDVDVRDSVTLFFRPMRPYTYHVARLARESSDRIFGTHSRKLPLDERYVSLFLAQLDHLDSLLSNLSTRIAFVLSAAAAAAHALPGEFEKERVYIMRACLHTLNLAWAALILPVHTDLVRRVEELSSGTVKSANERRRTKERVELLLRQVEQTTIKGARMVAKCVHEAPSLAFLTQMSQENLDGWARILMTCRNVEQGGEGITRREQEEELGWLLDGLKRMGWSWSDEGPLIASLESGLEALRLEPANPTSPPTITSVSPSAQPPSISLPPSAPTPPASNFDFTTFFSAASSPGGAGGGVSSLAGLAGLMGGGGLGGGFPLGSPTGASGAGVGGMGGLNDLLASSGFASMLGDPSLASNLAGLASSPAFAGLAAGMPGMENFLQSVGLGAAFSPPPSSQAPSNASTSGPTTTSAPSPTPSTDLNDLLSVPLFGGGAAGSASSVRGAAPSGLGGIPGFDGKGLEGEVRRGGGGASDDRSYIGSIDESQTGGGGDDEWMTL